MHRPRISGPALALAVALGCPGAALLTPAGATDAATARTVDLATGGALFRRLWVGAPASTQGSDGLGPLYNARSCAACHDGPPQPPTIHLGGPDGAPDPVYGRQIQTRGLVGQRAEARVELRQGAGAVVPMLSDLAYGPLDDGTALSVRRAPALRGLGLLAAIPEAAIRAGADPYDRDGDGISGRVRILADGRIGRFGWKAAMPTLADQVAQAFRDDIGLSSALRPDPAGDCTPAQAACRAAPDGGGGSGIEIGPPAFARLTAYVAALAPDPARPADPRGAALFAGLGCAGCHRADFGDPAVRPFSDLLLHDMGPALADRVREGMAAGAEWRTAPLWGLSRDGRGGFLHDGRARTLWQAILWHGGEARGARDKAMQLEPSGRAAVIRYLQSL